MGVSVTQEFLEANLFKRKLFSDGFFWVRNYTSSYSLQVNDELNEFVESDGGYVEYFCKEEFISLMTSHQNAIDE